MRRTRPSPLSTLSLSTLSLLTLALTLLPAGASARRVKPPPPEEPVVAQCASVRDLVLERAARDAVNSLFYYPMYRLGAAESADAQTSGAGGPSHYTGTNNQEAGIDEGDVVKTDGRTIYNIREREVVIVSSWPTKSMRVVGRYKLPDNATPSQLQLRGNKLVILSNIWETHDVAVQGDIAIGSRFAPIPNPAAFAGTRVTILDVRNPARPRLVAETDIEGWLSQSRLIGDELYLVSNAAIRVPTDVAAAALERAKQVVPSDRRMGDWQAIEAIREKAMIAVRATLRKRFARIDVSDAMPRTRSRMAGRKMSALQSMYSCDNLTMVAGAGDGGVVNVSQINLGRPTTVQTAGAIGNGWQIYASAQAIYVASARYEDGKSSTQILKFALSGRTWRGWRGWRAQGPRFESAGTVPGTLLNQFAMSEHRGALRVMTTDSQWGPNGQIDGAANSLFVMQPRGKSLRVVGKVTGLAAGERIFSARMFGDKGYMVTFRQTDPLFTFDLSNPTNPRLVGELKVNGFSSYIHPLDGDRLLTIGRDADDDGRIKGLHLQIFDVSNPAKPIRTHQELLEGGRYSHSSAQWDHHAFTFDPVTGTLALPISGYFEGSTSGNRYYSGLEVFEVGKRGIDYRGFVSHSDYTDGQNQWAGQITRSMVIGNSLVSISGVAIVASSLRDPNQPLGAARLAEAPTRRSPLDQPIVPQAMLTIAPLTR